MSRILEIPFEDFPGIFFRDLKSDFIFFSPLPSKFSLLLNKACSEVWNNTSLISFPLETQPSSFIEKFN